MYCRNCGKWIDDNAELCAECKETDEFFSEKSASAQPSVAETPYAAKPLVGSRKEGIAKGIVSLVLGVVATLFSIVALAFIELAIEEAYYGETVMDTLSEVGLLGGTTFCIVAGFLVAIPSLIMGILSIVTFKRASRAGRVKPIPTLIFGIVGLSTAVESFATALLALTTLAL